MLAGMWLCSALSRREIAMFAGNTHTNVQSIQYILSNHIFPALFNGLHFTVNTRNTYIRWLLRPRYTHVNEFRPCLKLIPTLKVLSM